MALPIRDIDRMLLPRFTLRTILAVVTVCALLFVVVGMAARGQTWAWGVVIGILSLLVTALVHAAWFGMVWMFAQIPTRNATERVSTGPAVAVPAPLEDAKVH